MSPVKFLLLAGMIGFTYNNTNVFSKPSMAWTNSDMITLVCAGMLTFFVLASSLLQHRPH